MVLDFTDGAAGAEGPRWQKEGGYLLFSDIGNNQRLKWTPGEGVSVFSEPTNNANGLPRDPQRWLIACEHGTRRVTLLDPDGSITAVADSYLGRRLNQTNDVAVKSDGSTYFTDPGHQTWTWISPGFIAYPQKTPDSWSRPP